MITRGWKEKHERSCGHELVAGKYYWRVLFYIFCSLDKYLLRRFKYVQTPVSKRNKSVAFFTPWLKYTGLLFFKKEMLQLFKILVSFYLLDFSLLKILTTTLLMLNKYIPSLLKYKIITVCFIFMHINILRIVSNIVHMFIL